MATWRTDPVQEEFERFVVEAAEVDPPGALGDLQALAVPGTRFW